MAKVEDHHHHQVQPLPFTEEEIKAQGEELVTLRMRTRVTGLESGVFVHPNWCTPKYSARVVRGAKRKEQHILCFLALEGDTGLPSRS